MSAQKQSTLSILQYNVQKSYAVMNLLLRNKSAWKFDIIAIQEPWINNYDEKATHNPSQGRFKAYLANADRPLVCFFINSKINPNSVRITGRGPNLSSTHITIATGDGEKTVTIHNIYNPQIHSDTFTEGRWEGIPQESAIPELDLALKKFEENDQLVVGDFNVYHEDWFGNLPMPECPQSKRAHAEALRTTMAEHGMELALPKGSITRPRADVRSNLRGTTLDLSWCSEGLTERVSTCRIREDLDMASDHMPIETVFLINHSRTPVRNRRDFKTMDIETFTKAITPLLPTNTDIKAVTTPGDLDRITEQVITAVQTAGTAATVEKTYTERSVPGFTPECRIAIDEVKKANSRRSKTGATALDFIDYQKAKRTRLKAIKRAQRDLHRDKVSKVKDEIGLWSLARWTRQRGTKTPAFTPDIQKADGSLAEDTSGKAEALRTVFFPKPPEADLTDISLYCYPISVETWVPITEWEVGEAMRDTPPDKAPGEDEIPNRVLKAAAETLRPIYTKLFNLSIQLQHCPARFKKSITVALRKPGKSDYSQPKSYRPVALMNTMGKVLDVVLAKRIQYYSEKHHLLPAAHTGGRKQSSCEHAVHLMLEKIHTAWRKRKVASLLMLDVSGAFDNVSHERLLHNLRKRRLPLEIVYWISSYLKGRTTQIKLYEGTSEPFDVLTGIPQGSPLSPILYLFYSADLLEIGRSKELVTGYIDDTSFMVEGSTTEVTAARLELLHMKADDWARKHASVFAPNKYELIHFIHKGDHKRIKDRGRTVDLGSNRVIAPTTHARYLGVILDEQLNGIKHMEHVKGRVEKSIQALKAISGSTWGATREDMLTLVKAIITPQMLYACSTWWISNPIQGKKTHRNKILQTLNALQKKALCVATGALRTTAAAVLEAETETLPIEVQLDQMSMITANRIKSSPMYLIMRIHRERGTFRKEHLRRSPLQELEMKVKRIVGEPAHQKIERQVPVMAEPWWRPPGCMIESEEEAVKSHNRLREVNLTTHMQVFTDGSDIGGRVGASAWEPFRKLKAQMDIGPSSQFTVYGAELCGIWMALDMAVKDQKARKLTIFTDNQAAILSTARPRNQSGQVILRKIYHLVNVLHQRKVQIGIRWIPAHVGVPGNEEADRLAKQATGYRAKGETGPIVRGVYLAWLPQLLSSCRREIKTIARRKWQDVWDEGDTGRAFKDRWGRYGQYTIPRHINKLYSNLTKAEGAVLIQLRTDRIGLRGYLHKIKRSETPWCDCRQSYQTAKHIIEECELYETERFEYLNTIHISDARLYLGDKKLVQQTVTFMRATGLLNQFTQLNQTASPLE